MHGALDCRPPLLLATVGTTIAWVLLMHLFRIMMALPLQAVLRRWIQLHTPSPAQETAHQS